MGSPEPGPRGGAGDGRLGHVRAAHAGARTLNAAAPARRSAGTLLAGIAVAVTLAGCASPPAPPSNVELPFDQAVATATDGLVAQARRLAAFRGGAPRATTVADPVIDATTGQQTVATALVDRRVGERVADRLASADIQAFDAAALPRARFVLTGTLTRGLAERPKGSMLINLALTELKTGTVVAQSWALARGDTVDATPLPCEADGPVRLRDKSVEAQVTTAATGAGQPAQALYLERLGTAALVADGARLCNDGRPADALARFQRAAAEGGGDSPRVLNGLYVTSHRTGRSADAERAFDRLVAAGLANQLFEVKFLFNPGGTVLTADGRYPSWLRRIARATVAAKVCLQVIGHTGNAGSPAAADALALQRAAFVRQRLIGEAAVLAGRTKAIGLGGARQNLVGIGTDNAVDALDRRVEFRVVACP